MQCKNPDCKETEPEFYKTNKLNCKSCLRAKQRKYRFTPAGIAAYKKWSDKNRKDYDAPRALTPESKNRLAEWKKYHTVNKDTLKHQIHSQCEDCIENMDRTGSVHCAPANGTESINHCDVYREWHDGGDHPLVDLRNFTDEENDYWSR